MWIDIDGAAIFANDGGKPFRPDRPAAILIHGAGCDQSIWGAQTRYLAHHGMAALAVDLPGHGRSGGVALESIADMADFMLNLVRVLDAEKPVLIGHSMGALLALEAASRAGAACAGLVLLGVGERMPVHPALLSAAQHDRRRAGRMIAGWGHGVRGHCGGNPSHGIWMLRAAERLIAASRPGVLYTGLKACADYRDAAAAARNTVCPAMLLLGRDDKMTPPKAAQPLADALPDLRRRTVLPHVGHMISVEAPHQTRDALMGFLGTMTMTAAPA